MNTVNCLESERIVGQWLEGERTPAASDHLRTCGVCSVKVADLEAIITASASLPELDPPERVWISLRAHLESEGLLRPRRTWAQRLLGYIPATPRTAVATAAIYAVASIFLFLPQSPEPGRVSQASMWGLTRVSDQLAHGEADANRDVHLRDPQVAASYQQNLALVDDLIGECQRKVNEDPNDELAREYLVTAYQQKADLLNALSERDAMGD